ncbi:MAG: APC family permease [Ktedonobacteraceae bacterium]
MATTKRSSVSEADIVPRTPLLSQNYVHATMPGILGRFDMLAIYVVALFLITNGVLGATGGPVSLLYLLIGAITFFIPSIIATAQLGTMFPYEGGIYNWTYQALGANWSFFAGILFWITGVLASITGATALVTTIQGLNPNWLVEPWQQGAIILIILTLAAFICIQRFRTTQIVVNGIFILTMISVFLIGLAVAVWLLQGHASATNFTDPTGWSINSGNFSYLGIITLNFIGVNGPLNMAGEIASSETGRKSIITRQLRWGSLIVFACYFLVMLAVLVVRGSAMLSAPVLAFEGFTVVYQVLGKLAGGIASLCFMSYGVVAAIFYCYSSSRILMVAGIDGRLPVSFGKVNRNRVPAFAVLFQLVLGGAVVVLIFFAFPSLGFGGNAANALVDSYNVLSAATTLVWTVATMFLFINVAALFRKRASWTHAYRLFHMAWIWYSVIIGLIACVATIAGVLAYSWVPQLLSNSTWLLLVGGLTAICLTLVFIVSMIATSEASYESMQQ